MNCFQQDKLCIMKSSGKLIFLFITEKVKGCYLCALLIFIKFHGSLCACFLSAQLAKYQNSVLALSALSLFYPPLGKSQDLTLIFSHSKVGRKRDSAFSHQVTGKS